MVLVSHDDGSTELISIREDSVPITLITENTSRETGDCGSPALEIESLPNTPSPAPTSPSPTQSPAPTLTPR